MGGRLLGTAVLVIAVLLGVWWLGTVVWAVLHILEFVAIAVVTGVAGYKLGVHHGRRHPR